MGNTLKTTFLLAVLTVLFVLVGKAIGGQSGMVFAFGLAVVMNVGSYWFSDKIVLRMYGAREVTEAEAPQLHGMVRRLAEKKARELGYAEIDEVTLDQFKGQMMGRMGGDGDFPLG